MHVSERKTRRRRSRKGFRNVVDGQAIGGEEIGWGDDDDCFYYHSCRNNVVIVFGNLSSCLTYLHIVSE